MNAEKEMDYLKTLEISQYLDELIVEYMLKSL
ncbi:Spo0E family sporulation regulatory protein-aspartic acid phosphatase [Clostridium tetanomorphum]